MLAQVLNPTEIKKNGPATRPASAPARRRASPFTAVSAVLPATAQSYGDARGSVNARSLAGVGGSKPRCHSTARESNLNWTSSRAQDHRAQPSTARPYARSLMAGHGVAYRSPPGPVNMFGSFSHGFASATPE